MPAASATHSKPSLLPYLLLVITTMSFASNWVVGRGLQDHASPLVMTFARWTIAFIVILPFSQGHLGRDLPSICARWPTLLVLGLLGSLVFSGLGYWGLRYTSAINASLMNSSLPLFIALIARIILGTRIKGLQAVGMVVSLCGVLLLISRGELTALLGLAVNPGDLLILTGVLTWSIYTVTLRWRPPAVHPLTLLTSTCAIGMFSSAPLLAWELSRGVMPALTPGVLLWLVFLGLFPSLAAFFCWNAAVKSLGPSVAGLFIHLVPVFGTIFSIIFLGEQLHLYHLAAISLVFAGLFVSSRA